ncbi:sugar O-acyltransferase, sialic acid O-acetyltransferase NeuD family [Amphritea atlantica]|uniref:Sugar O-acyltransferase, sialic acid O-acetyltransferase NeuD family n=1 Tax=Amphritea atlantica TaxID=355243 RepID=A0A1H9K9J9_9GAMM|nr:acetyltransferase [Amphritea atlantica]SEQ95545.1 sugar O-acyltransferase, sialic acid O-acetyltransferase NeuD family [Amphritea atlantica]
MKKLIVVGSGGHGKVVAEAAYASEKYESVLFLDSHYPQCKDEKVIGHSDSFVEHISDNVEFIVAIGDSSVRYYLSNQICLHGGVLAVVIHPDAVLSNRVNLGLGTFIGALAVVNSGSRIGMSCIINTCALVEHDCNIGDGVHISPKAALAGHVIVGDKTWIGIGATIIDKIVIGESVIVGAGAVVINNIKDGKTVVGIPAKETAK